MDSKSRQEPEMEKGSNQNGNARSVVIDITRTSHREGNLKDELEYIYKQLQTTKAALAAARGEVRALSEYLLIAQEDERRRIARELHDDISQRAAMVDYQLERVAHLVHEPEGKQALSAARADLATLAKVLRDISHQLHPSIITDLGLPAALTQLVCEFNESGGSATLTNGLDAPIFDPVVGTALYRIAQEALRNVRKHAGAVPVHIALRAKASDIYLSIHDSGPGFVVEAVGDRGLGLLSMRERARLIGASLMIQSQPGDGTHIAVRARLGASAKANLGTN